MTDKNKTKKQLIDELAKSRWQIKELEKIVFGQKKIEETIKENTAKYRLLTESSQDGIYIIGTEGFEYVNPAFKKMLGYNTKEIFSKDFNFLDTVHPDDRKLITERKEARKKGKKLPSLYSFRIITKSGKTKQVEVNTAPLPGEGTRILGIFRDITEQKQAEEKIKASLKEKEVLLQEIHHRVKNNMQIVVSLLRLQSHAAKDKKIKDMFKVAQSRIRSMAIIHEKLYRSKDFAVIDFALYIQSLATHLMQTYQIDPKQINLKTDVKDVYLDINQGLPVGLLLNELVSNALKHAFPKGKKGEIIVKFHADKKGKKTLIVRDNGIGHPDKVDISKPETLGMQLIKDLTKQIGGKLDLDTKAGTAFTITFS